MAQGRVQAYAKGEGGKENGSKTREEGVAFITGRCCRGLPAGRCDAVPEAAWPSGGTIARRCVCDISNRGSPGPRDGNLKIKSA